MTVGLILDLVGAVGDNPADLDAQIRTIYDWHHARGVAAIQLALAPAAIVALSAVAAGATTAVVIVAVAVFGIGIGIGIWRLVQLTRFDREYIFALHLARAFAPLHGRLHLWVEDDCCGPELPGLRSVSMVEYRSKAEVRQAVRTKWDRLSSGEIA